MVTCFYFIPVLPVNLIYLLRLISFSISRILINALAEQFVHHNRKWVNPERV